ncbi:MAG TPA: hypothetical protein VGG16_15445 [Streptosporangiaceae bacterium]|jgi:hypothetical protein
MFIVWLMASASATTPLIGALLFKFGLTDMIIAIVAAWLIGFIPAGLFSEMGLLLQHAAAASSGGSRRGHPVRRGRRLLAAAASSGRGDDPGRLDGALAELNAAIDIGDEAPPASPLILERIGL